MFCFLDNAPYFYFSSSSRLFYFIFYGEEKISITFNNTNGVIQEFSIFKGDNYDFWYVKIRTLLRSQDLWNFVEKESKETNGENRKKKCESVFFIQQLVDDLTFSHIASTTQSKEPLELNTCRCIWGRCRHRRSVANIPVVFVDDYVAGCHPPGLILKVFLKWLPFLKSELQKTCHFFFNLTHMTYRPATNAKLLCLLGQSLLYICTEYQQYISISTTTYIHQSTTNLCHAFPYS